MDLVVNTDGAKEEFEEGKLWNSLYYPTRECHYSDEEAVEIADRVKQRLMDWIHSHEHGFVTTEEIRDKAMEELEKEDEDIAFMYDKHLDIN